MNTPERASTSLGSVKDSRSPCPSWPRLSRVIIYMNQKKVLN